MQNVQILGGYFPLNVTAIDAVFLNVETGYGYGGANTYVNGASWFYRCKWDHSTTAVVNTTALPIPARANTTVYAAGDSVVVSSYVLTCQTGGTSGGSAPTLLNYGRDITDGTVTWRLGAPQTFSGLYIDSSAGENHFHMCDLTGLYSQSLTQAGGSLTYTVFSDGVLSSPVAVNSGKLFALHHCELGDDIGVDTGYSGITHISNNYGVTSTIDIDIGIGANVNDFLITANYLGGGTITVVAGTSDHYVISGNVRTTVTDGGTGVNKSVTGNVA